MTTHTLDSVKAEIAHFLAMWLSLDPKEDPRNWIVIPEDYHARLPIIRAVLDGGQ